MKRIYSKLLTILLGSTAITLPTVAASCNSAKNNQDDSGKSQERNSTDVYNNFFKNLDIPVFGLSQNDITHLNQTKVYIRQYFDLLTNETYAVLQQIAANPSEYSGAAQDPTFSFGLSISKERYAESVNKIADQVIESFNVNNSISSVLYVSGITAAIRTMSQEAYNKISYLRQLMGDKFPQSLAFKINNMGQFVLMYMQGPVQISLINSQTLARLDYFVANSSNDELKAKANELKAKLSENAEAIAKVFKPYSDFVEKNLGNEISEDKLREFVNPPFELLEQHRVLINQYKSTLAYPYLELVQPTSKVQDALKYKSVNVWNYDIKYRYAAINDVPLYKNVFNSIKDLEQSVELDQASRASETSSNQPTETTNNTSGENDNSTPAAPKKSKAQILDEFKQQIETNHDTILGSSDGYVEDLVPDFVAKIKVKIGNQTRNGYISVISKKDGQFKKFAVDSEINPNNQKLLSEQFKDAKENYIIKYTWDFAPIEINGQLQGNPLVTEFISPWESQTSEEEVRKFVEAFGTFPVYYVPYNLLDFKKDADNKFSAMMINRSLPEHRFADVYWDRFFYGTSTYNLLVNVDFTGSANPYNSIFNTELVSHNLTSYFTISDEIYDSLIKANIIEMSLEQKEKIVELQTKIKEWYNQKVDYVADDYSYINIPADLITDNKITNDTKLKYLQAQIDYVEGNFDYYEASVANKAQEILTIDEELKKTDLTEEKRTELNTKKEKLLEEQKADQAKKEEFNTLKTSKLEALNTKLTEAKASLVELQKQLETINEEFNVKQAEKFENVELSFVLR
ncbi:hypothetical protein [Mycoplasma nasistruthionis]|uniref:Uncharacterized protein n=1 Tax=Mycoplasma nasistruthionis TaxID=353852 RepID=A0A4Y6I630_9MOLU|nr:hypothetical protein [Mycoplasma nasistruthionis]QDF64767.1 hypothetical protein FIV53_00305 [Mycoplasma nasistruthionis]